LKIELCRNTSLTECIQERDTIAAQMAANAEKGSPRGEPEGEDPSIFESRVMGLNLCKLVFQTDIFKEDIRKGYMMDPFFRKVIEKMRTHPSFEIKEGIIWMKNRGGEDIVCIPSTILADTTLKTKILDQAHQVVGHYGPQRMSDYIRCWYWWLHIYTDTKKFCKSCKTCMQAKGEYQKPMGKLHLLPIATRPWDSIGMDFIGPLPQVDRYNYLWVVICHMTSMVHLIPVNMKTTVSQLSNIYV